MNETQLGARFTAAQTVARAAGAVALARFRDREDLAVEHKGE